MFNVLAEKTEIGWVMKSAELLGAYLTFHDTKWCDFSLGNTNQIYHVDSNDV